MVRGDTMWKLAVQYQVGTSEIIASNPQVSQSPTLIYPGQILTIPRRGRGGHPVRTGSDPSGQRNSGAERAERPDLQLGLSRVARYKSQDMVDNPISPPSPTYGTPFQMIRSFRALYRSAGENIAYGQRTPPGCGQCLDELQRPPGQYSEQLLYADRRGLCGQRSLLDRCSSAERPGYSYSPDGHGLAGAIPAPARLLS